MVNDDYVDVEAEGELITLWNSTCCTTFMLCGLCYYLLVSNSLGDYGFGFPIGNSSAKEKKRELERCLQLMKGNVYNFFFLFSNSNLIQLYKSEASEDIILLFIFDEHRETH